MSRRLLILSSLLGPYANAAPTNGTNDTKDCKCIPGDSCWPSTSDFSSLNDTLSGQLIQGVPPASVCYTTQSDYNKTACEVVQENWFSSPFHAADPISVGWPWWANNSCPPIYPNGTSVTGDTKAESKGCSIGAYPAYAVNATKEEHVVAAVKFAKQHNIRLVVKSTGHSFQGRSTALGSLSIWTHHMRGAQYHEHFQPESCPPNETHMAFTVAAGERVRDVYEAANEHNTVVVAGSDQDVGVVGWFTGGGHGPLSSTYGLGVDNILQIRLVTPDGILRTANSGVNPDLFWALRGGGGGTFGVITEVTMKAYPAPQASRYSLTVSLIDPDNETGYWDIVAYIVSELPRLKEAGAQGYVNIIPPGMVPELGDSVSWASSWRIDFHEKPNETVESLFAPIKEKLDPENGTTILYTAQVEHYPTFFALWNTTVKFEPVASGGAAFGSRLMPADSLTGDPQQLSLVLQNLTAAADDSSIRPVLELCLVANNNTDMNKETSVTPAWRDAVLHLMVIEAYPDSASLEEAKPVLDRMTNERIAALKSLAPISGSYLNEADPWDPNWQYEYWGENYPKLRGVKKAYDPDSLLWCLSCVGSEEWTERDGRLCRVPWADAIDDE